MQTTQEVNNIIFFFFSYVSVACFIYSQNIMLSFNHMFVDDDDEQEADNGVGRAPRRLSLSAQVIFQV